MEPNSPEFTPVIVKYITVVGGWVGSTALVIYTALRKYTRLEMKVESLQEQITNNLPPNGCTGVRERCRLEIENEVSTKLSDFTISFLGEIAHMKQDTALIKQEIEHISDKVETGFKDLKDIVRGVTE